MSYQRTEIDAENFRDIFPEGCKFYEKPELPKIEFKANKVKYSVTDIRLLNGAAVYAFQNILNDVANEPDIEEVSFKIEDGISEDELDIVTDILLGISYTAKKGGKHGFNVSSNFLVEGIKHYKTEDGEILTVKLVKDHAQVIYEYAQEHEQLNMFELVIAIEEKCIQTIQTWMIEQQAESECKG